MPERYVSKFPLAARARPVALSVESITTLIPTAASWAWMNCASRSARRSCSTVSRCTVGFGNPDAATSFFASVGVVRRARNLRRVVPGGVCRWDQGAADLHEAAEDDLVHRVSVDRLLERLPQLRARRERRAHGRVRQVAEAVLVADVDEDALPAELGRRDHPQARGLPDARELGRRDLIEYLDVARLSAAAAAGASGIGL